MPLLKTTKTVGGEITNKLGQISSALNFGCSDTQLLHLYRVQCLHVARPHFILISKTNESRQHVDAE